jgi:hypothetical protein
MGLLAKLDGAAQEGACLKRFLRAGFVPVPALLSCALALLVRDELWRPGARVTTGERVPLGSLAHSALATIAFVTLVYFVSLHPNARHLMGSGRVRQPVSEAEQGCALALLRVMMMAILYFFAVRLWRVG